MSGETVPLNFRDVGEFVNCIAGAALMRENRFFRGGKIEPGRSLSRLQYPRTILNLRNSPDPAPLGPGVKVYDLGTANSLEKYDTTLPEVRQWLNRVLSVLADPDLAFPVYIHCASGRDRTGVAVASLLMLLEIPEQVIIQEYLLSFSIAEQETATALIFGALEGMKNRKNYFHRLNPERLKKNLLNPGRPRTEI